MQALRAFEAAARLQSLSRAAESLHLTHGAISHQIKALEGELGVSLVERAGRGIRLTDEGERFAARVREALDRLAEAVRDVTDKSNPRRIRVSVVPSFAARWLLPRIGRFIARHPDIDLDVRATLVLVDFQRDDVDFGVRHGVGNWPGVVAEPMFDETYFPVCSPRIAGGVPKTPADLARYVLLRGEGEPWEPWFRAAGLDWPEPTRGAMFNDSSHMAQAAAEGQGIALVRESLLGNDLATGALVRLFDISIPAPRRFWFVYPERMVHSPKLALFRDWLFAELEQDRVLAARARAMKRSDNASKPGTTGAPRKSPRRARG
jgi:LysR family glycine cleavage system transcriptional activator